MAGAALDDVVGATITTARRAVLRTAGSADGDVRGPLELVFDYTRARTLHASPRRTLHVGLGPWRAPSAGPAPSAAAAGAGERWELVDLAETGAVDLRGATVRAVEWERDESDAPVGVRLVLDRGAVRAWLWSGDLRVDAEL